MKKRTAIPLRHNIGPKVSAPIFLLTTLLMSLSQSCDDTDPVRTVSSKMVMVWNGQIQKAYTFPVGVGQPPLIISRLFAMYHIAMHDALNSIKPKYKTYTSQVMDLKADPDASVVQAVYDVLTQIGPQEGPHKFSIDSLFNASMASIPDGDAKEKGIALGKTVAKAVLDKRSADVPFLQLTGYNPTPPSGDQPGEYKYLPPLNYAFAGFHLMKPWAMTSGKQFPVEPPYAINSIEYATDYKEVMELGDLNSTKRTEDQKSLGIFWAENTSRGWNEIARATLETTGEALDAFETARLLAILHIAIADAYISVFDSKMQYNYWRPITAIKEGETDGNPDTQGKPTWQPTLVTPPMGEYPSAHAMTGAAAGQVLINHFGKSNIAFNVTSGYFPGTRSFTSIDAAIRENSLSRIYIGYHFRKAVDVGEEVGYEIGDYVYHNALQAK